MGDPPGESPVGSPPLKAVSSRRLPNFVRRDGPTDLVVHYFHNKKHQNCERSLATFFNKNIKPCEEYFIVRRLNFLHVFY